jgi:predicted nuclease with TOPRIM domain
MITQVESLKKLESLAKQAAAALQSVSAENRALSEKLHKLEVEYKRVKEELREAKLTLARHDRLKARLVKLSEKLERIA